MKEDEHRTRAGEFLSSHLSYHISYFLWLDDEEREVYRRVLDHERSNGARTNDGSSTVSGVYERGDQSEQFDPRNALTVQISMICARRPRVFLCQCSTHECDHRRKLYTLNCRSVVDVPCKECHLDEFVNRAMRDLLSEQRAKCRHRGMTNDVHRSMPLEHAEETDELISYVNHALVSR